MSLLSRIRSFRDAPLRRRPGIQKLFDLCLYVFEIPGSRSRAPRNDVFRSYAPIAIFGSASAFAFNSFSARRYSTGITLRNFGKLAFQFARISTARLEPVSLAWRV